MPKRILVTGSRDWKDRQTIYKVLDRHSRGGRVTIVHGDCPTGADRMAQDWADMMSQESEKHPADWKKYGRAAGPKRNQAMVDLGADICLAFVIPGSRGTIDCMKRAQKAGIEIVETEG